MTMETIIFFLNHTLTYCIIVDLGQCLSTYVKPWERQVELNDLDQFEQLYNCPL